MSVFEQGETPLWDRRGLLATLGDYRAHRLEGCVQWPEPGGQRVALGDVGQPSFASDVQGLRKETRPLFKRLMVQLTLLSCLKRKVLSD